MTSVLKTLRFAHTKRIQTYSRCPSSRRRSGAGVLGQSGTPTRARAGPPRGERGRGQSWCQIPQPESVTSQWLPSPEPCQSRPLSERRVAVSHLEGFRRRRGREGVTPLGTVESRRFEENFKKKRKKEREREGEKKCRFATAGEPPRCRTSSSTARGPGGGASGSQVLPATCR